MAYGTFETPGGKQVTINADLNDEAGQIEVEIDGSSVYSGPRQDSVKDHNGDVVEVNASSFVVRVSIGDDSVTLQPNGEFETQGSMQVA